MDKDYVMDIEGDGGAGIKNNRGPLPISKDIKRHNSGRKIIYCSGKEANAMFEHCLGLFSSFSPLESRTPPSQLT